MMFRLAVLLLATVLLCIAGPISAQTVRWIVTGLPLILRDWPLIQRMMSGKTS